MTKKTNWIFVLCLAALFALTGCSQNDSASRTSASQVATVNDVLQSGITQTETAAAPTDAPAITTPPIIETTPTAEPVERVDVDLTKLSSTMVYSQVYDMLTQSQDYIGMTVKMAGYFTEYHDTMNDNVYYTCFIQDAAACCAQGIEFVLKEDQAYPKDGDPITVVGVFDTYEEDGYLYCTLREASLA